MLASEDDPISTRRCYDEESGKFEDFFAHAERALTGALVARYGPEDGRIAALEALSWAWEHWERVRSMNNPTGYLYRVGQSRVRLSRRWVHLMPMADRPAAWTNTEPDVVLAEALDSLTTRQRQAVVLTVGYGYTQVETAALLGIKPSTVQNHAERGLFKLRSLLTSEEE